MNATIALPSPWINSSTSFFAPAAVSNPPMPKSSTSVDASQAQLAFERFQQAKSLVERQSALADLLESHAAPLIQTIVRKKVRATVTTSELLEIEQQIQCKLLARLRCVDEEPLHDFAGYVAVVSYNACAEWQRMRQPQRHALKNRLRYMLTHTAGLALWEVQPRVWIAGQSQWQARTKSAPNGRFPNADELRSYGENLPHSSSLRELACAVFAQVSQPVELDELVNLLAERLNISDAVTAEQELNDLADAKPDVATTLERRAYLQKLWAEIIQLPVSQRQALLLNLRDPEGGNQLALFHLTGIANLSELAQALELGVEEFVTLWHKLPLDDLGLAARLGITRQQIINLRLAARRRLARRMGEA